ncbi:MAG: hypothetical protein NTV92_00440, partial [Candidatus Bipolaricaulota bacterium]|nr:hypothetical protein [Candidatus Bipolaricaulota bacterium]
MSSRPTRDDVRALALEILRGKPDPAVRVRLLRDVLSGESRDQRLRDARGTLEDSAHVALLRRAQRADGSWGRLHSRDTRSPQLVQTTEWAVERALALGLEARHPLLATACVHLASVVEGQAAVSDPAERNDRWATGLRLFAAATLSRIDPQHSSLDSVWDLWHEIARRAFAGGTYDPDREAAAHIDLTGASVRGTYLVLSNRYALLLLGARADRLDAELRRAIVLWVGRKVDGVGYYGLPLGSPPDELTPGLLERFLQSHEVFASFGAGAAATGPLVDWLGEHRRPDGLWDLGSRASWTAQ